MSTMTIDHSTATAHDRDSTPDTREVEAAEELLVDVLNHGALALMASIGHRVGLFATMAGAGPSTSREIADTADLDERYVRECLNALVTGGIVTHDSADGTYQLPEAFARVTTDRGDNLAAFTQYIAMMGVVEDDIVTCFREGGGLSYDHFPRFHEVMEEDSGGSVVAALDGHILPLLDRHSELEAGIDWLDLGCGRGQAVIALAERFPASRFVGVDLSEEAIAYARATAAAAGLDNATFVVDDLTDFDDTAEPRAFDVVSTFDAVHDQARPDRLLAGIRRSLRPGGVYLMQDIHASSDVNENAEHPLGTLLYALSTTHCMTVSLANDGHGVGTMWGREMARSYLHGAGFSDITVQQLDHDVQNDYWIIRP